MVDELNIPVQFKGNKCLFSSCVPTRAELDTCQHFDMTGHNEWNEDSVNIFDLSKIYQLSEIDKRYTIRPNVILCTPTHSEHPTISMICIHIMNLIFTKPFCWKFSPVLYYWRSFLLRKSIVQWQQPHKLEYNQKLCPSDVARIMIKRRTSKDSKAFFNWHILC